MKVAELKRLPVGTKLLLVECLLGPVPPEKQPRTVAAHGSTEMRLTKSDGQSSYLRYPKAADLHDNDSGFWVTEDGDFAARYLYACRCCGVNAGTTLMLDGFRYCTQCVAK